MKKLNEYNDYHELLNDLKEKYGIPKASYFTNNVSYSQRQSIKRGKEGLYLHHDFEDTAIMLSHPQFNIENKYPYEWHEPENLTYCNTLEHLMLHVLIATRKQGVVNAKLKQETGTGGAVNFIVPQINTYISRAYEYKPQWLKTALSMFDDEKVVEQYYVCLEYLVKNYRGILFTDKARLISKLASPDLLVDCDKDKFSHFREYLITRLSEQIE
jgi:hypothetical protein